MASHKAPGYDKVPVRVIKDCLPHILPIITYLINSSFASNTFPKSWKKAAEIVPHLKDGDHEVANNNRPISLLPVLLPYTKLFTNYLTAKNKFTCHQSGNKNFHRNPEFTCYRSYLYSNGRKENDIHGLHRLKQGVLTAFVTLLYLTNCTISRSPKMP
jgi:hypothetical protein